MREELLSPAVDFLRSPKVQTSPLANKISFLEKKGLTNEEIQEAIKRANITQTSTPQTQTQQTQLTHDQQPISPQMQMQTQMQTSQVVAQNSSQSLSWKDIFIGTSIVGGALYFGFGILQVKKKSLFYFILFYFIQIQLTFFISFLFRNIYLLLNSIL